MSTMSGVDDVCNRSDWELSKENIQPLKRGRKMANLSAAFGESSNEYQSRMHQEIQNFEAAIRTYEGDDALEVWYRYFVWFCENFPTGGKDQHVLLERCITLFKDEDKYKNDERYLKIWLRYADLSTDPVIVFEYMHSQGICIKLTDFYEYWAYVFERQGNVKKADELYNLGKDIKAQPIEKLQRLHRAFEMRLSENFKHSSIESNDESDNQRTALVGLKAHGKRGTVGFKRTGNAVLASTGGVAASTGGGISHPRQSNNKNPAFTVFNETKDMKSIAPSTGDWQMPPTRQTLTKENTQKPAKWNEAKLSQRHQRASIPVNDVGIKPSFKVHEDEEGIVNPPCTPQHLNMIDHVLSSRKPGKDATNVLLASMTKINKSDDKFKVMYCKDKIYAGAKEFSFEQLRAARMQARLAGAPWSSLYPTQKDPNVQFKVMYPKHEVYPFDSGEQPYDKILLKRYYARKERQIVEAVNQASFSDCPQEVQSLNADKTIEKMDTGSCHEILQHSQPAFQVYNKNHDDICDNQPARRELSFQCDQYRETTENLIYKNHEPPMTDVHPAIACQGSFKPVGNHSMPLGRPTQFITTNRSNVLDMQQGPHNAQYGQARHLANDNQMGVDPYTASPTVTINTKDAVDLVMAMFSNPLGMDNEDELTWMKQQSVPTVEREFEAAFKEDKTDKLDRSQEFSIFDETAIDKSIPLTQTRRDEEDEENRPPQDYVQEKTNRPIVGVLQPSQGIPVCPRENDVNIDDDDDEHVPPNNFHGNRTIDSCNKTTGDVTEDMNYLANFKMAARMASTPYSQGLDPPSFVLSTIKAPKDAVHESMEYSANTFACTPNKVLSPIFERSDEDTRSTASSTTMSSRGSVSQRISNAIKLESIIEDKHNVSGAQKSSKNNTMNTKDCLSTQELTREEGTCQIDNISNLNPFSDEVTENLLHNIAPPVSTYNGYFSCNENVPLIVEKCAIDLGENDLYQVRHRIGAGAFAKVFCAYKLSPDLGADDDDRSEVTLKIQNIPSNWEFYLCRQLHARIDAMSCLSETHAMFMNPSNIYNYANGSVLVDEYSPLGTLLDVSNMYKTTAHCTEEIATSVAISLLRMLITMHSCAIIHGDFKPDNILLLESGSHNEINLKLIDFGCGIDMQLFPVGTMFSVNCFTEGFQCIEMKTGQPWSLQVDTYGMLGVLYCLIHGDYMKVYQKGTRWTQNRSFKRHWNVELWNNMFDILLNTPNPDEIATHCKDLLQEFLDFREILCPAQSAILELEKQMKSKTK